MAAVALRTGRASRAGQREEPSMATLAGTTIPFSQQSDTLDKPEAPQRCDVVIIGGGIAGLTVALTLPPDLRVALVTKGALGESNTRYAQGGLAAAVGRDASPDLHLPDAL